MLVGVVESCLDDGDGDGEARPVGVPNVERRVVKGFRGNELVLEVRFPPDWVCPVLLLDRSLPFFPGVDGSNPPISPLITTEDAGELPGVSTRLPRVDRSLDTILEIESRSCWLLLSA